MGLFGDKMDQLRISGDHSEALIRFLEEWFNDKEYVEAHTSGSTGTPKQIKLLKSDMIVSARRTISFFRLDSGSILALPLGVDYIAGKMMICRALESGAKVWVETPSRNLLIEFQGDRIDLLSIVPSQIDSLIKRCRHINVRNTIIGGAPMTDEDERKLMDHGLTAYATYGMTETCSHVALRKIGSPIYTALPGIKFGTDSDGCLIIYCQDMSIGRIDTNDIVRLLNDTQFEWLGRRDNVINSGGIKLHPEVIEQKLSGVIEFPYYISSRKSNIWGEELILVIESDLKLDIESSLIELLNPIERPKAIIYETAFKRTSSGKIIRKRF